MLYLLTQQTTQSVHGNYCVSNPVPEGYSIYGITGTVQLRTSNKKIPFVMKCDIELINTKKEQEQDFTVYIQSLYASFLEITSTNRIA